MRQIVTTRNGGVEVLRIEEKPDPIPKSGEAIIRVRAAGLNFADILARQMQAKRIPLRSADHILVIDVVVRQPGIPVRFRGERKVTR